MDEQPPINRGPRVLGPAGEDIHPKEKEKYRAATRAKATTWVGTARRVTIFLTPRATARPPAPALRNHSAHEFELELILPQMAQRPVLRGEVGARALRVRLVSRGEV